MTKLTTTPTDAQKPKFRLSDAYYAKLIASGDSVIITPNEDKEVIALPTSIAPARVDLFIGDEFLARITGTLIGNCIVLTSAAWATHNGKLDHLIRKAATTEFLFKLPS